MNRIFFVELSTIYIVLWYNIADSFVCFFLGIVICLLVGSKLYNIEWTQSSEFRSGFNIEPIHVSCCQQRVAPMSTSQSEVNDVQCQQDPDPLVIANTYIF